VLIRNAAHNRDLWVWSGDSAALQTYLLHYIAGIEGQSILWLGESVSTQDPLNLSIRQVNSHTARTELGGEFELVVADVSKQFDSDAIAAISGTIVGGGRLLLLTPPLQEWADADAWNLRRFIRLLLHHTKLCSINDMWQAQSPDGYRYSEPDGADPSTLQFRRLASTLGHSSEQRSGVSLTEQDALIAKLYQRITSTDHQVSLLSADRGRGKSAALGRLLAQLQMSDAGLQVGSVLVCAPSRRATDVLYRHYDQLHPESRPTFCPPDQLLEHHADLLIVDEAASIPLALLRTLINRFKQVIFATTVHGYEGGGRGFALRFAQLLQRDGIRVEQHTLHDPIRWAPNDSLETFCHAVFMLEAPLPPTPALWSGDCSNLQLEHVSRERLATDESLLVQIYGLLVQAHYRTTPNDLRYMLDNSGLRTFVLRYNQQTVAAALVTDEGPLTNIRLRQAILAKQRRPTGHRLPQLLAQYTLMSAAMDLRCARIVRIAVHPLLQSQGIGSTFLTQLRHHYQHQDYDLIGAMFGAVPETVRFWLRNEFYALHLGFKPQTSSGYRSLTVGCPIGHIALDVINRARLLYADTQCFRDHVNSAATAKDSAQLYDHALLLRYCAGQRSFHDTHAALARFSKRCVHNSSAGHEDLLQLCADPHANIRTLARDTGATSQSTLESQLRQLVSDRLAG